MTHYPHTTTVVRAVGRVVVVRAVVRAVLQTTV